MSDFKKDTDETPNDGIEVMNLHLKEQQARWEELFASQSQPNPDAQPEVVPETAPAGSAVQDLRLQILQAEGVTPEALPWIKGETVDEIKADVFKLTCHFPSLLLVNRDGGGFAPARQDSTVHVTNSSDLARLLSGGN